MIAKYAVLVRRQSPTRLGDVIVRLPNCLRYPQQLARQQIWQKARFAGLVDLSNQWSSAHPLGQDMEESAC